MKKKDKLKRAEKIEGALTLYQVLIDAKESGVYLDFHREYNRLMQRIFNALERECLDGE